MVYTLHMMMLLYHMMWLLELLHSLWYTINFFSLLYGLCITTCIKKLYGLCDIGNEQLHCLFLLLQVCLVFRIMLHAVMKCASAVQSLWKRGGSTIKKLIFFFMWVPYIFTVFKVIACCLRTHDCTYHFSSF